MSSKDQPLGLHDPDDWIGWWLSLHPSELFAGELARFALARLEDDAIPEGIGWGEVRLVERGDTIQVAIEYLLEVFPHGRIFHLLAIRSRGDPPRPMSG